MRILAFLHDPIQAQHDVRGHPENPGRVDTVMQRLREQRMLDRLQALPPRIATVAELELAHSPRHVARMIDLDAAGGGAIDPDTAMVPGSYKAATHAAGALLSGVDAVLGGAADTAYCLVRPPGHHATADRAMGFCFFNNVAIAAGYARQRHGIERLAIIDFDVHHGNGTQDIFWDDPSVLYLSAHEYPFYPGTGGWRETGGPNARGQTVNLPLPAGTGDGEYLRSFDRLLLPVIERFQPELLLISAGYDAHRADPLADMAVSTEGYEAIMLRLRQLADDTCDGRIVAALEGGYNYEALAASVEASLEVLLADAPSWEPAPASQERFERYLDELRTLHGLPEG